MKAILQLRITKWYFKLTYIVVAYLVGLGLHIALKSADGLHVIMSIVDFLVTLAQFLLGARLFRGRGEPVEPPRAWWRMTAWAPLSRVLSIYFVLVALIAPINLLQAAFGDHLAVASVGPTKIAEFISDGLSNATLAFLYVNSAIRLRKVRKPVREQGFPSYVSAK